MACYGAREVNGQHLYSACFPVASLARALWVWSWLDVDYMVATSGRHDLRIDFLRTYGLSLAFFCVLHGLSLDMCTGECGAVERGGDGLELVRWVCSPCIYALCTFIHICGRLGGGGYSGRRLVVWPAGGESTSFLYLKLDRESGLFLYTCGRRYV